MLYAGQRIESSSVLLTRPWLLLLLLVSATFCETLHNQIIITVWRHTQSTNRDWLCGYLCLAARLQPLSHVTERKTTS